MRQHLKRTRQIEAAIRTELLRRSATNEPTPAQRILVDLIDVRLGVIDKLINDMDAESDLPFTEAMTRLGQHFDKDTASPYRVFRGPTPADQPSLAKDIVVVFDDLVARGIWGGACPVLDPRWNLQ